MDSLTAILDGANSATLDTSLREVALSLLLAFVLGQGVAWVYIWTHSGLSYSRSFTQSLVVMTLLVALVMFIVGNSIVTAFGLLGALALIRFRNVLKDTRDTVFVFLSLAVGMACGTQRYATGIIGTLAVLLLIAYLDWTAFGTFGGFDGYVTLHLAPGTSPALAAPVLGRHCRSVKAVAERRAGADQPYELVYQLGLRDRDRAGELVEDLRALPGLSEVSLALRDELAEI